jgi:hypothetical protein
MRRPRNWKTTLAGIGAIAAGTLLPVVGVPAAICTAVAAFCTGILGLAAKDHDVTGGTRAK